MKMQSIHDIGYELINEVMEQGLSKIGLTIKNLSDEKLNNLKVNLYSLDTFNIEPVEGEYVINSLGKDDEKKIYFKVKANHSGRIYFTFDGYSPSRFFTQTLPMIVRVKTQQAEFETFLVLSNPYLKKGKRSIEIETQIRGRDHTIGLFVEILCMRPSGEIEVVDEIILDELREGEIQTYFSEFWPVENGRHEIHAYLHDDLERIDYANDKMMVID